MFLLAVLSVVACAFAADPSDKSLFHDTHSLLWRDCGGSDAWIKMSDFNMTPKPLRLPGHAALTVHGINNGPGISQNAVLDVNIQKRLLNKWTQIPCTGDLGTCRYNDTCHFIQVLFPQGKCPQEFTDNGLPCTCPFTIGHGKSITLNDDAVEMGAVKPIYTWLTTGEFYIKLQMYETGKTAERMCLEFYINLQK
ncbi:ganglioside GM2 activator-like [Littorina saxatilis]|uniref:MD-2-related lipid-recognition domain-containing protein n=1 Tax=Littorina saxatilis TaxID=31220 RepID=A0AAN9GHB2_9CAEN